MKNDDGLYPRGIREFVLRMFLKHVDEGTTPPPELMDFVADGIRRYLKHGEPWPTPNGRKRTWPNIAKGLQAFGLERLRFNRERAATILELHSKDPDAGSDYSRTHRNLIKRGKQFLRNPIADCSSATPAQMIDFDFDRFYELAMSDLTENPHLSKEELAKIREEVQLLKTAREEEREPGLSKPGN